MKKWLLVALLISAIISFLCIYIFIPSRLNISKFTGLSCSYNGALRMISSSDNWSKWWPPAKHNPGSDDNIFVHRSDTFSITKKFDNSIEVNIRHKGIDYTSNLILIQVNFDSVLSEWRCEFAAGKNPLTRIRSYREAVQIKKSMDEILGRLQKFLEKKDNVYGIPIQKMSTTDTLLISRQTFIDHYPATAEIYQYINLIRGYLQQQGSPETSVPMLNVTPLPEGKYKVRVAIATDRKLPGTKDLEFKYMIKGTFLVTDVTGGQKDVQQKLDLLELYAGDYNIPVMAIPFQYLLTDRLKEPDSSKWLTRIYLPVYH